MSAKPASRVGKGLSRRERTCLWHVLDAKNRPLWDGSLCWRNLSFRVGKVLSCRKNAPGARFRQKKAPHF